MNRILYCFLVFGVVMNLGTRGMAQDVISLEELWGQLESNNYSLQLAQQNLRSAEVLTSKYNRGYLPTLSVNSGMNYGITNQRSRFNFNLPDFEVRNATSFSANVRASLDYLVFDNGQRKLRNKRNSGNVLNAKLQVEDLQQLLKFNLAQIYFSLAQAQYSVGLLNETIDISKQRLDRANSFYEYGSRSKVDVLNAKVDLSRDSLNLVAANNDIENLKWQLNELTLMESIDYLVDTTIYLNYQLNSYEELEQAMFQNNSELKVLRSTIDLITIDQEIAKRTNSPTVNANTNYNVNYLNNNEKGQLDFSRSNTIDIGFTANWNILDGGQRKVQSQLALVELTTANLELESRQNELRAQLRRLWNTYQNNLLTIKLEAQNIESNKVNFARVRELYNRGQQSSVEFRQAQLNLLNAQLLHYNAKITAKLNEIEIDYLLNK